MQAIDFLLLYPLKTRMDNISYRFISFQATFATTHYTQDFAVCQASP